jgi:hypothetical protein
MFAYRESTYRSPRTREPQRRVDSQALRRSALIASVVVLTMLLLPGCGDDNHPPANQTAFERALRGIGSGISPTGTGYGWIDLPDRGRFADTADALAPGPNDVVANPHPLESVGIELSGADQATSIAASYGYAVRLDGVSPGRLPMLLRAAGASARDHGDWTDYDLGDQWQAPLEGPLRALGDLAARIAVGSDAVILSRTDMGREALEDVGPSPVEAPANAFAAACLGEVSSARLLPGSFTHNPFASPALIAIGVRHAGRDEVLCAIGYSPKQTQKWQRALRMSFAATATEPLIGGPIRRSVRQATVDRFQEGELYAARAEIMRAAGEPPGFLYRALSRGSVLTYVGAPKPIPDGTKLQLEP